MQRIIPFCNDRTAKSSMIIVYFLIAIEKATNNPLKERKFNPNFIRMNKTIYNAATKIQNLPLLNLLRFEFLAVLDVPQ